MYTIFVVTSLIFLYGFYRRWRVYRLGKPLNRLDHIIQRIIRYLKRAFAQLRVLLVRLPGIAHAFLFWGMLILFIATAIITIQVDFTQPLFKWEFWKGVFYEYYSLFTDLAGVVVFGMLIVFGVRRYILKPAGLETTWDDKLIYALLMAILFTGFIIEGARMAVTEVQANPTLAVFSPVGLGTARLLLPLGEGTLRELHRLTWWVHFFLVMGFIGIIPYTKLRHILTTPANYLIADLREKGSLAPLDLDSPDIDHFGASRVTDLAWKDIFDADACTKCKRCQDRCPAWATDKPLSPMKVVLQIGEVAFGDPAADLIATVTPEVLWACTTCRACEEICPADIEHITKIMEMRRHMVLMEGKFPGDEVVLAVNNLEVNGNPFGLPPASRSDWMEGLPVERLADGKPVDILYFVGCYASFDKRNQAVARSFIKVCASAGSGWVSWAMRNAAAASRCASWAMNTFTARLPPGISRNSAPMAFRRLSPPARIASTPLSGITASLGWNWRWNTTRSSSSAWSARGHYRSSRRNSILPITTPAISAVIKASLTSRAACWRQVVVAFRKCQRIVWRAFAVAAVVGGYWQRKKLAGVSASNGLEWPRPPAPPRLSQIVLFA